MGALAVLALAVATALAPPARAQSSPQPLGPYDGTNPFVCELQNVGTGVEYPDPDADPLCVEFDKTNQNVTDFGLVDFLSKEPDRVAAASPKCFYFQRDHWTGSVVQGQPPELWHWDGNYFFDKGQGIGGVNVTNFRVGGQTSDPTQFAPPEYQPFFNESGGGGLTKLQGGAQPDCAARVDTPEEREEIYGGEPLFPECISPGGDLHARKVGKVELGMSRKQVLKRLAAPRNHERGADRWCVTGGASLRVAYRHGSPRGVALIRTTVRGHSERGVRPHMRAELARRRLDLRHRFDLGPATVLEAPRHDGRRLFAAIRNGRVSWLAMTDPDRLRGEHATKRALRQTG